MSKGHPISEVCGDPLRVWYERPHLGTDFPIFPALLLAMF